MQKNGAQRVDTWPFRLSEATWARLWAVLRTEDRPPLPYTDEAEARGLVMALLYCALSGGALRGLPPAAPPAQAVNAACTHWAELGVLARLSEIVRIHLA
jgi:transposase